MKIKTIVAAVIAATALSGCATIVGDSTQRMDISSSPDGANVSIKDEKGEVVYKSTTPTTVTLQKSDGSYWGGKSYIVTIAKEGFQEQSIPVKSSANGWYIGGNVLVGGLIGWLIVDPLNGGMYTLSPDAISTSLSAQSASHNNSSKNGDIKVVLIKDVPDDLRDQLVKLN